MDQSKVNLERIRACDAEEGEWRTINGAHVLIKNGRIASGAGGALNGQPFRGGSLKKMQSGSKGMESGAYGRKLEPQAKEVAERNRSAMARRNAQYDLAGKAARYKSNRGEVASRAQRALERYRKSREAEKGGASAPQQSAPHATKLGRMQPGSTAVNAGKEANRLDHNARVYHRNAASYNSRTKKLQDLAKALHQKHPELARKAEAAKEYAGRVASKQKKLEGTLAFIIGRNFGTHYRKGTKARINAALKNMEMDRLVANKYPEFYNDDRNDLLNAHADLEALIRAENAKKNR